jgi:hypothetical protein
MIKDNITFSAFKQSKLPLVIIYSDINHMSFPQAKRVGNPSAEKRFRPSRNDKLRWNYVVLYNFMLILFLNSFAYGAEWEYYGQDQDVNFLYVDKDSMKDANGIMQVWQKKVYHSDNLFRIRQTLGETYYKLIEKLTLYEIHCPTKTIQERAFAYYDNNNKVIDSRYYEVMRDWKKILPNTDMARLYWICCRKEEKK